MNCISKHSVWDSMRYAKRLHVYLEYHVTDDVGWIFVLSALLFNHVKFCI